MEKNINAVFYEFKYYILPEAYSDLKSIENGTVINAKRLKEEECMAPNFVYESIVDETLEIADSSHLFPVQVNLYTKNEYNDILRQQVNRVCPGCLRYQDDGEEGLDGHHREISLDGICYERDDDENSVTYAMRVVWFYNALAEKLDELAECIEKKKADKFDKICKECARVMMSPERFYGTKRDGKYYIYIQCSLGYDLYITLLTYTAFASRHAENPITKAGWVIIPFIPEGADGYKGKIKGKTPVGSLELSEIPWRYILKLKNDKKLTGEAFDKLCDDVYKYLCFQIGEDRVLRVIEGVDGEKSSAAVLTAYEICEKLREMDAQLPGSFPPYLPYSWENCEKHTPYKKSVEGASTCFTFANIGADPSLAAEVDFDNEFAHAYIYVSADGENADTVFETLRYYFENEQSVPEPVLMKEDFTVSFMSTGYCECNNDGEHGWIIDFFVADEKMFYRFLRILAPVLTTYSARLIVINSAGINEYVCGKDVLPVGGEVSN